MSLKWLPRDNDLKNHELFDDTYFRKDPPGVIYELRQICDPEGNPAKGLNAAWITLNNPSQHNSYTTGERDTLSAENGMVIYNSTTNRLEAYENGSWVDI